MKLFPDIILFYELSIVTLQKVYFPTHTHTRARTYRNIYLFLLGLFFAHLFAVCSFSQ